MENTNDDNTFIDKYLNIGIKDSLKSLFIEKQDNVNKILEEIDLCNIYLSNPEIKIKHALVSSDIQFDESLELESKPKLIKYIEENISVEDFDIKWEEPFVSKDGILKKMVLL